jgi:SP family sugar:H+ symporter-like MFS transporter
MLVSAVAFLLSALGSGWAASVPEFVVYRLLGGLAVGAASVLAPAYIAEIAPAHIRGRLGSLQQLAIVLGISVALMSNYALAGAAGGTAEAWVGGFAAWRWMFWMEAIPSALYLGLLLFIPESPRYLVARGRDDEAAAVLGRLMEPARVPALVQEIHASLHGERKPQLRDLFEPGTLRLLPIVWVGIALAALQQLSGINVIFYYGSVLWQAAGFTESHALLINVVSGLINIGSTLVAMTLVDRVGRKPLLLAGAAAMTAALGVVAVLFATASTDAAGALALTPASAWGALVAAHLFIIGFGITWGPVLWVLLGEMFPNRIRGSALAVSAFVLWMMNFAITMSFPVLLDGIGLGGAYALYAGFAALSFVVARRTVRETRGRTLESMTAGRASA